MFDSSESEISDDARSEGEDGPLHHPFVMRDPSSLPNIVMNIRVCSIVGSACFRMIKVEYRQMRHIMCTCIQEV